MTPEVVGLVGGTVVRPVSVDDRESPIIRVPRGAAPAPERVLAGRQQLSDERRYDVPVTAVCPEYTADDLRGWVEDGEESVSELARIRDVEYVDLPGGHWPQLTQPDKLAQVILDAAELSRDTLENPSSQTPPHR